MWRGLRGVSRLLAVVVAAGVAGLLALVGARASPTWPATPPTSAGSPATATTSGSTTRSDRPLRPAPGPQPVHHRPGGRRPGGHAPADRRRPHAPGGPLLGRAQVAAAYLAAHPAHVARVVFSSPGALAPAIDDGSAGGVRGRLPLAEQLRLYALLVRPRALLGYTLLQVNPRAAHAFVGDAEMDARNDRVYNRGRAGTHCRDAGPGPALHGLGFYTYQFPQSAAARPWADPRPALARLATPALVIKGSCDYLSWSSGLAYRHALPRAELVYLHRAGHNAYQDRPAAYLAVVRAFLADRPLPIPAWTGDGVPADYEGPP